MDGSGLDQVFHALADPTRRAVVRRLAARPATVSELHHPFDMKLPSFLQHLRVLEASGLVRSSKVGRVRTVELRREALDHAGRWLDEQRDLWERRLDQLDAYLDTLKEGET
ncbi:MAG: metalloregulator ArsR/SmtB family transcription factor [Myxococcota bacterium]